jgi:hypothetical protein
VHGFDTDCILKISKGRLEVGEPTNCDSIPSMDKRLSLKLSQTSSEVAPYSSVTEGFSAGIKRLSREANQSSPLSAKVQNV